MSIRTQNLVSILPVFLFLAVVSAGLMLKTVREEYLWGLREEASSLAVATAEFIPGACFRELVERGSGAPYYLRLAPALDRILKQKQAQRIFGLTPDGRHLLFSRGGPPGDATGHLLPTPAELAAIDRGEPLGTSVKTDRRGRIVMTAYARVHDWQRTGSEPLAPECAYALRPSDNGVDGARGAPSPVGLLGVETDARGMESLTRELLARGGWIIGAVLILGAAATLSVSAVVSREVRNLTDGAALVKRGSLDHSIEAGCIQEVWDLCNTFNTMSDVLKDVLAKTKRSLLEGELFRSEADLAETYTRLFWPKLSAGGVDVGGLTPGRSRYAHSAALWDGVEVVAKRLGDRPDGSFFGAFPIEGGVCALVGKVQAPSAQLLSSELRGPGYGGRHLSRTAASPRRSNPELTSPAEGGPSPLDTVVTASAVYALLSEQLRDGDPAVVLAQTRDLFPLETLDAAFCRRGEADGPLPVERWTLDSGAAAPVRNLSTLARGPLALHTLGAPVTKGRGPRGGGNGCPPGPPPAVAEPQDIVDRSLASLGHLEAHELLEDIALSLPVDRNGCLMIVKDSTQRGHQ
jgi:HAMP domain-containing protein